MIKSVQRFTGNEYLTESYIKNHLNQELIEELIKGGLIEYQTVDDRLNRETEVRAIIYAGHIKK
jgi:hypothetical protein